MRIFLSGPMGSGKSSVARVVGILVSVALTLLSVLYMAAIRRHFVTAGEGEDQT